MSAKLDRIIRVILIAAMVFTALAQGAVEAWSVAVFELMILAALALWAMKSLSDKRLAITVPSLMLPIAALLGLALIESVAFTDAAGRRLGLSMDVEATRRFAAVLFFLLAAMLAFSNFFAGRDRLHTFANVLVVYGLALAVFAIIQHYTWNGHFFWIAPTERASAFGPFVNKNHCAGYLEMLMPVPVALLLSGRMRAEARLFYAFAAAMMGIAIVVSLSRGGMISMFAALAFIALMSTLIRRESGAEARAVLWLRPVVRVGAIIVMAVTIVLGVLWVGADSVLNLIDTTMDQAQAPGALVQYTRGWIWKDSWSMVRAHPLIGVGLGAYPTVYATYSHNDGTMTVTESHNDYLQILADGGIVGGALALWFLALLFRDMVRSLKSRDPGLASIGLGGSAGIFAILVHSCFDFNLQLPSNALLFLLLAATVSLIGRAGAVPQPHSEGRRAVHTDAPAVESARP